MRRWERSNAESNAGWWIENINLTFTYKHTRAPVARQHRSTVPGRDTYTFSFNASDADSRKQTPR